MYNFNQYITPDKEILVNISFESIIKEINPDNLIKSYKISNLWKGKFFLKKLIKKIFKYQLLTTLKWDNRFWNNITVHLIKAKINLTPNNTNIELIIKERTIPSRFKDIKKYQDLINKNVEIGSPLYITGEALNFFGTQVKNDDIFILDGSRRLIANILNNSNPEILLIDLKKKM